MVGAVGIAVFVGAVIGCGLMLAYLDWYHKRECKRYMDRALDRMGWGPRKHE